MSGKLSKKITLILCLLLAFSLFAACSTPPAVTTTAATTAATTTAATTAATTTTEATTTVATTTAAPVFDFGGATITMAANADYLRPNLETQEGVTKAELQAAAEAKYNVKIEYLVLANEEYKDKMITSIMNGEPVANLFYMGSPDAVPALIKQGLFLALEDVDTVPSELSIPVADFQKVAGYDGKTYGFTTAVAVDTIGVFYNRKLMSDNGYPDPHTWIATKEWTWDKFREIAIAMTKDVDGDGTNDQWGCMTYAGDWLWFLIQASGGNIYDVANNKQLLDQPKSIAAMDYMYKLFNEDKVVKPGGWAFMGDFVVGNIAMCPSFSWYGGEIKNSEIADGFGFLPMPLAPGQTEYINPARQINCYFLAKGTENPGQVLNVWKEMQIWTAERPSPYNLGQFANDDDIAVAEMLEDGTMNFDYFAGMHGGIIDEVGTALSDGTMTGAQAAQSFGPKLQDKFDGK